MTNQQPTVSSSLTDIDYEEPSFQPAEARFFLDPTKLMDRVTQKHIIQQDRSKVSSDTDPIPVALFIKAGMFE
jgi:hypothetical protein